MLTQLNLSTTDLETLESDEVGFWCDDCDDLVVGETKGDNDLVCVYCDCVLVTIV